MPNSNPLSAFTRSVFGGNRDSGDDVESPDAVLSGLAKRYRKAAGEAFANDREQEAKEFKDGAIKIEALIGNLRGLPRATR